VELIIEFIVELVLQLVVEVLLQPGFNWLERFLRTTVGRVVVTLLVSAITGILLGVLWGRHVADLPSPAFPRAVWVSLALAGLGVVVAVLRNARADVSAALDRLPAVVRPDGIRLSGFVVLNLALALGMTMGYGAGSV
jgi:uncharacterized protein YacL